MVFATAPPGRERSRLCAARDGKWVHILRAEAGGRTPQPSPLDPQLAVIPLAVQRVPQRHPKDAHRGVQVANCQQARGALVRQKVEEDLKSVLGDVFWLEAV